MLVKGATGDAYMDQGIGMHLCLSEPAHHLVVPIFSVADLTDDFSIMIQIWWKFDFTATPS